MPLFHKSRIILGCYDKNNGIKLELMVEIKMYQFFEKGMRGGISYIAHRYGKANNKYMIRKDPQSIHLHLHLFS